MESVGSGAGKSVPAQVVRVVAPLAPTFSRTLQIVLRLPDASEASLTALGSLVGQRFSAPKVPSGVISPALTAVA